MQKLLVVEPSPFARSVRTYCDFHLETTATADTIVAPMLSKQLRTAYKQHAETARGPLKPV